MSNIVDKVFDNSEDGKPNYAIDLVDGTRLYYRGKVMNPMPQSGDAINFTVINVKTSKGGNPYILMSKMFLLLTIIHLMMICQMEFL